ncbi:uncharacterized protein LOC133440573 [Cololabis saira]|uniref:uncharacterized protein LOC133440573 n=1 Tax=Cololabis saira TaxID=129043 RepID=UPI002AD42491|nr:uncharacterized protein LOC133440573 [Cololabis saira]
MGNVPSEHSMGNSLRCCICSRVLPPCRSFNDYSRATVHGQEVYVFNGGEYFRHVGHNSIYKCEYCFHKEVRDREEMRREEERRREEEQRRREEEMRREEEQRRREEEMIRQEEQRRRQEEQRTRQEQMRREEEQRRREEQMRRQEEQRRRQEEQRTRQEQMRREEEQRRRQEEQKRREEQMRRQEEQRRRQEEQKRREEEMRKQEEQRRRQEEQRRRQEEQMRRQEEQRRREEEMRREEEQKRREEEMRRQEEQRRRQEEQKRREEEMRRQEEQRRRQEEQKRRQAEQRRREEEMRREEEQKRRQEEQRRRQEEQMRREEERRRQEEQMRRQEEQRRREEEMRRQEEQKRREEEMRREEERKREEEHRRREEEMRREEERKREELNQRLQKSRNQAEKQHEKQITDTILQESKKKVLKGHLDEFEAESDKSSDDFLAILSLKCDIEVSDLSLPELTADQLGKILPALDKLLFSEWIIDPPSLSTLQHTQVYVTELSALSLETSQGVVLQVISDHVHFLVGSIDKSASNYSESLTLTQALYLTLIHFLDETGECNADAVLIAKRWMGDELSTEKIFVVEFLSVLTSSLQTAVERSSVFITKMEVECLKLLLSELTDSIQTHSETTKIILTLVEKNQWSPTEALNLLKELSQKCAQGDSVVKVLTLIQVNDVSPDWTDEHGHSLTQVLGNMDIQDFQKILRRKDEHSLLSAVAELKMSQNLDDDEISFIKNITTGVVKHLENVPTNSPSSRYSLKDGALNEDNIQNCLSLLCKAVFDTKGWWPTVKHMVHWCVLVIKKKTGAPQLVGIEEDPCVIAMFAAACVYMGNKVDIVLSSVDHSKEQSEEWSAFYNNLGISLNTNMKTDASLRDVYGADIVYGILDDFVSDYFQHGKDVMENRQPQLIRGFIIDAKSLSSLEKLDLSKLKQNESEVVAAEVMETLVHKFQSEEMGLKCRFIKGLFQGLHTNLIDTNTKSEFIQVFNKITGKPLLSNQIFVLTIVENLLKVLTNESVDGKIMTSAANRWCLDVLFPCAEQFQGSKEEAKEVFQMASTLGVPSLWPPTEILSLLGALAHHHHDEDCISIMKVLHLMTTYQVSSKWTDERNRSLLELIDSHTTENLIQHLEKSFADEKCKSVDMLFNEIRQMKDIDEQTLSKSETVVTYVTNLIKSGDIDKHKDVQRAKSLGHSLETEDLQEVLAVLCNAVHLHIAKGKWFPRATQMMSWCLLALSDNGKLLEMGTGEGKSCVIAMFAVLRVLRGEKVDVVSSSSVLCQRDAEEWSEFYNYFNITVDTNTNKTEDEDRKECYQKDVVYGTIDAFAADHLRQIFEMKDVRPDRSYQCVIIDEVDSLLLDQGVQLTYLSSPMVSMEHLNTILAMIWGHVSQYGFLSSGHRTFVQGPPASFFKAVFDSINTEETGIDDPMDILNIAEQTNTVPMGFTEAIFKSEKNLPDQLKTVSQDAMVEFFEELEDYIPYGFTIYTPDDKGLLCLRKVSPYNKHQIPELTFLVLEEGLCCPLYDSEESLIRPIADFITEKIQYTPCTNNKYKISIPGFLKSLIESKVSAWVQNGFLAMQLREGRDYVVENNNVCPVDFRSTGIVELNKKWGDGLQQFVEIKHQIKLSTISTVTNYISNISLFKKYEGKIYGTTGTLGGKTDILFLQDLYPNLSACKMPTFNRKLLFEVKGTLKKSEEWKSEIKRTVMAQISPNSYRGGRAALVICETINKANEIYEDLKSNVPGEIILYCRSDKDSLSKMEKELFPGDVIVATNLAGRGTDIKVSKQVNNNGGLFVILSFLSENQRVELQAFGRTARKGKPGSAQIITITENLQQDFSMVTSLKEVKRNRDKCAVEKINSMMDDVTEMNLREELFSEYCETLQQIYRDTAGDEKRAVVAVMNEFWGIWLQIHSEDIEQLKRDELQLRLKDDVSKAKSQSENQTSPSSSIYHYIKFGNIALDKKQWDVSTKLFEKAMNQDESWASIAFYNHAYCTIMQRNPDYLTNAITDLRKAKDSLEYLIEESLICLQFVKMSTATSTNNDPTSLEKQFTTKCNMYKSFDENITEAIKKLEEIRDKEKDALAKKSPVFSLVSSADEELQAEAYNLYNKGMKYIFAVEEEPTLWGALVVLFLGILQIVAGVLLTVFTFGTLAKVGMGLITEGVSDCIYGIEALVTGEFSWKSWAIEKAISIGISLISFGVGKLIKLVKQGFKAFKMALKGLGKKLKALPKFLSKQAKASFSQVTKTSMKNAIKSSSKHIVKEVIFKGLEKAQDALLKEILERIKTDLSKRIVEQVKTNIDNNPLNTLVDSIILSHLEHKEQLNDLLKDKDRRSDLLFIFKRYSKTALQPFKADLDWQNKLNSSIIKIMDAARAHTTGKAHTILTIIKTVHYGILAADATAAVLTLSDKFFLKLKEELNSFKKERSMTEKVEINDLSSSELEMLREFKQELAGTISELLADALVEVSHQKFFSHIVSSVQGKVNDAIREKAESGFNKVKDKFRDHQKQKAAKASKLSRSHAEKVKNPKTRGAILDVQFLSEVTGTKAVILTQDRRGKLTKMQVMNPTNKPASQTVTLIYTPKSAQYPDGRYDALINNTVIFTDGKTSLFHAFAQGIKPNAGQHEVTLEANRLRSMEAADLLRNPGQWEGLIKRSEWTQRVRGGNWYMAEGAEPNRIIKDSKTVTIPGVWKVKQYKEWQKHATQNPEIGKILNTDRQPPVRSMLEAKNMNLSGKLAQAMLKERAKSSPLDPNLITDVQKYRGHEFPAVYGPKKAHSPFADSKYEDFRSNLARTMSKDDVEGTFKLTILGAMMRQLDGGSSSNILQMKRKNTSRLAMFDHSFQEQSLKLVDGWFSRLQGSGVMTVDHHLTMTTWIKRKGYRDQNDPHTVQITNFLQ